MLTILVVLSISTLTVSEPLSSTEVEDILDYHNKMRSTVKPSATDMMEMTYSQKLADLADRWVSKCIYGHPNSRQHPEYAGTGQNLAGTGGSPRNTTKMATYWWNEVKHYTYKNNKCAQYKVCGHYTQMAWAKTTKVGCAIARCDHMLKWPPPVYLMACQYKPQGNYYGEKPYTEGASCTKCPVGTKCRNALCVDTNRQP